MHNLFSFLDILFNEFISFFKYFYIGPKRGPGVGTGSGSICRGELDNESDKDKDKDKERADKDKERADEDNIEVYVPDNAIDLGGLKQVSLEFLHSFIPSFL